MQAGPAAPNPGRTSSRQAAVAVQVRIHGESWWELVGSRHYDIDVIVGVRAIMISYYNKSHNDVIAGVMSHL